MYHSATEHRISTRLRALSGGSFSPVPAGSPSSFSWRSAFSRTRHTSSSTETAISAATAMNTGV